MAVNHLIHDGNGGSREVTTTPIKAIRLFCLECMCYQPSEIRKCTAPLCPLYPYRMGKAGTGRRGNPEFLPSRADKTEQG